MSKFEYVTVLLSIIIAFAASEILSGIGRLVREAARVTFYWVHVSWMLLTILAMILHWWGIWDYRGVEFNSFVYFLALLAPSLTFVLAAFLITPALPPQGRLDLRAFYFEHRARIFPIGALIMFEFSFLRVTLGEESVLSLGNVFRAAGAGVLVSLAFAKDARIHGGAAFACYALLLLYYVIVGDRAA